MTDDGTRYALWLLLPGEARERYAALIELLARQYATPRFEPHITLLGDLTGEEAALAEQTRALARELEPFELRLLEAGYEDETYRCLYIYTAVSRALEYARERARERFGRRIETGFVPHLSLVYGALDEDEKERILDRIGRYFDETVTIREIALYAIEGRPEQWRSVVRVPLGGSGDESV
jgi:2'-5' RNA ligase